MDIARKFESHTVSICRHAFRTDFSCKINSKSNFREIVDFQKNALRRSAANDNLFKLFFLHPILASKIYINTVKKQI